jgi:erythromycin esterase-like protein
MIDYTEGLRRLAKPLSRQTISENIVEAIKDRRIVMLGESSHGTEEYYSWRKQISLELMIKHGFSFIAVEGDWPDAARLNDYIQTGRGDSAHKVLQKFHRWPTWMWANNQVAELAEKMRGLGMHFYGLDVYSLYSSIDAVIDFVKTYVPRIADEVIERYSCFEPFQSDEIGYAYSLKQDPSGCTKEVVKTLTQLLELRLNHSMGAHQKLFDAQQNARIVKNAESYYRAMVDTADLSWNVRDQHMLETLEILLDRHGGGAKAIVWAHNTHIGDYRATDMIRQGYVNIGGLAREKFGKDEVALVGFGSYEGSVTASHAWDGDEEVKFLPKAREGSLEDRLHQVTEEQEASGLVMSWLKPEAASGVLGQEILQRAVGVVYDPRHERRSNYVPTNFLERYDAFVFIDKTKALRSLHVPYIYNEFPETWPSGV